MSEDQKSDAKILRIDITGSCPRIGKTALTAIVADAIDKAIPNIPVEVHSGEGDFHYRYDALLEGDALDIQADRVVIVDNNAAYTAPDASKTGRTYTLRDVVERIATE